MKKREAVSILLFSLAWVLPIACGAGIDRDDTTKKTTTNDLQKQQTDYDTVIIGNRIWMAGNLNIKTPNGSWCYDNDYANCEKYGRLYNWETAKTICPEGWKLPTKSDFETLLSNFDGEGEKAYHALIKDGNSKFNAHLGGWKSKHFFDRLETKGNWWSATEYDSYDAWQLYLLGNMEHAGITNDDKQLGLSVRCLR